MKDGFLRVASATPHIKVADCTGNSQVIYFYRELYLMPLKKILK